jgi:DNA-binding NarL/FixJ family response regulator
MTADSIRIVIADDHPIFRDGFRLLLKDQQEVQLVGEAANGKDLIRIVSREKPDVVVTDIKMPEVEGIAACRHIKKEFPSIQVIALSMFNEDHLIIEMLEAGASGYILKNTNQEELLTAVKAVHEGNTFYSDATSKKLQRLIGKSKFDPYKNAKYKRLSEREIDVLRLICEQLSTKEIAGILNLSIRTVESHREHIQEKTGSRNLVGMAIYAIKHGIYEIKE